MDPATEPFMGGLARSPRAVLALDYDGTLAPFRTRPQDAVPYPGVRELLRRIMTTGRTRVVLISGRPAAEVRGLLALDPGPEIWGAHGWERLRAGETPVPGSPDDDIVEILARAREALESRGLLGHAEWKIASVVVHWRGAGDAAAIEADARAVLAPLAADPAFEIMPIAEGLELRCRRRHKGTALATVLAEESPDVPAAYLGDDQTDEDAFRVLVGRGVAGRGLAVRGLAVRVASVPVVTAADVRLAPAEGVVRFLARWLEATTSGPAWSGPLDAVPRRST